MDTRPQDTRPDPPREGTLISAALKAAGISVRTAAKAANISEGWWRQIVKGYQTTSGGGIGPVRGPAETVARMALAAGVTPEQLVEAGRDDAARHLRVLAAPATAAPAPAPRAPDLRSNIIAAALEGLTPEEAELILEEELRRRRNDPGSREGDSRRVS